MDFDSADVPPLPTRAHNHHAHSRRRSLQGPSSSKRNSGLPPASPEVISNLITSLSVISRPATNHFEASPTSLSLPASPGNEVREAQAAKVPAACDHSSEIVHPDRRQKDLQLRPRTMMPRV
ncbi:hypothetical protein LB505_000918 [Fusarium chuoi]|nr:hypothetical protein LB505_000918 [Fusarium chuoi]